MIKKILIIVAIVSIIIKLDIDNPISFFNREHTLGINYYNNFHHVEHTGSTWDNREYGFRISHSLHINKNIKSLLNFDYKEISRLIDLLIFDKLIAF